MPPKPSPLVSFLIAAAAVLFHLALGLAWLSVDQRVPAADEAHHTTLVLQYGRLMRDEYLPEVLEKLPGLEVAYPPASHMAAGLLAGLFGEGRGTPLIAGVLWLGLLVFCTHRLASRWLDGRIAHTAAALLATCPALYCQTRTFLPELPTAAIVLLAVLLLDKFADSGLMFEAVLLGLVGGIGLLTKFTFPTHVLGCAAVILATAHAPRRRLAAGAALAVVLAWAIAWWWYGFMLDERIEWIRRSRSMVEQTYPTSWKDPLGWAFYPLALASFPGTLPFMLLAAAGFPAAARMPGRARGVLFVWLAVFAAVFVPTPIKWGEYAMPILPILAMTGAIGLDRWFGSYKVGPLAALAGVALAFPVTFGVDLQRPVTAPEGLWARALLGPWRTMREKILDLPPDGDASMWKSDWYGFSSVGYPMDEVLAEIEKLPFHGLVVIQPDDTLEADWESFALAGLRSNSSETFCGIGELHRYKPERLTGLVVHEPHEWLPTYATFKDLAQQGHLGELPSIAVEGGARTRLHLAKRITSMATVIWLYTRRTD